MGTGSRGPSWQAAAACCSVALVSLAAAIAYPTMVFNGPLLPYLPAGIATGLMAAAMLSVVIALGSGFRGTVAYMQAAATVMTAILAMSLAQDLLRQQRPEQLLPTVLALICAVTVTCGLVLFILGYYRLGGLIRYVPIPVVAGFLAGTGWLLLKAAVAAGTGLAVSWAALPQLLEPLHLAQALLALAGGATLWLLERYRPRAYNAVLLLALLGLGFWLVAAALGLDRAALHRAGWLLPATERLALWSAPQHLGDLGSADWMLVLRVMPEMLAVAAVNAVNFLVVASSIELATDKDLDLNRELRLAGVANLATGALGGLPGHHSAPATILAHRLGQRNRIVGVVSGLAACAMLLWGGPALNYLPKLLCGTLLAWIGIGFLHTWLVQRLRVMALTDIVVTLIVFLTAISLGIMQALAAGTAAGMVLFVLRYSSIPVARDTLSGSVSRSNIGRSDDQRAILQQSGDGILILKLHSFVFFGTANSLVSLVDRRLQRKDLPDLRYLLIDLRLVSGIDSSAAASFAKLERRGRQRRFKLVLCHVSEAIQPLLDGVLSPSAAGTSVRYFPDLDRAQEWAEDKILRNHGAQPHQAAIDFDALLLRIFGAADALRAQDYFDVLELDAGDVLAHMGEVSRDIFVIESGRVEVLLRRAGARDLRVGVMEAGTLIGEMAMYLGTPRTASLVALTQTQVRRLRAESLEAMQRDQPLLAAALHRHIAAALAGKLVDMNRLVSALGA